MAGVRSQYLSSIRPLRSPARDRCQTAMPGQVSQRLVTGGSGPCKLPILLHLVSSYGECRVNLLMLKLTNSQKGHIKQHYNYLSVLFYKLYFKNLNSTHSVSVKKHFLSHFNKVYRYHLIFIYLETAAVVRPYLFYAYIVAVLYWFV